MDRLPAHTHTFANVERHEKARSVGRNREFFRAKVTEAGDPFAKLCPIHARAVSISDFDSRLEEAIGCFSNVVRCVRNLIRPMGLRRNRQRKLHDVEIDWNSIDYMCIDMNVNFPTIYVNFYENAVLKSITVNNLLKNRSCGKVASQFRTTRMINWWEIPTINNAFARKFKTQIIVFFKYNSYFALGTHENIKMYPTITSNGTVWKPDEPQELILRLFLSTFSRRNNSHRLSGLFPIRYYINSSFLPSVHIDFQDCFQAWFNRTDSSLNVARPSTENPQPRFIKVAGSGLRKVYRGGLD